MPSTIVVINHETNQVENVTTDGVALQYEVQKRASVIELPRTVVTEFCPVLSKNSRAVEVVLLKSTLAKCEQSVCLATVPFPSARVPTACSFVEGCVYVLPADRPPEPHSFFPVNWRYASGFSLIEIEPVIDETTGAHLSTEFMLSRQFTAKMAAFSHENRGVNNFEDCPAFVLADTLKHLRQFAHGAGKFDPLLNVFDPQFMQTCKLRLQADDYIGFYSSDWSTASGDTKLLAGHVEASKHFYALVKYTLPVESVDQLKHIVFTNPNNATWAKLIKSPVFNRAEKIASSIRAKFLTDILAIAGLKPKKSNAHIVETMFDLFDGAPVNVSKADGTETQGVTFYSGCGATHRSDRGILMEMAPERDAGVLWLHGPPSSRIGGDAFKIPDVVNALPVVATQRITKKTLEMFSTCGWNKQNGYIKMEPLVFV